MKNNVFWALLPILTILLLPGLFSQQINLFVPLPFFFLALLFILIFSLKNYFFVPFFGAIAVSFLSVQPMALFVLSLLLSSYSSKISSSFFKGKTILSSLPSFIIFCAAYAITFNLLSFIF